MAFAITNYNIVKEPEIVYHQGKYYSVNSGRFAGSSLPVPIGVNGLGSWFSKKIWKPIKKVVKPLTKILTAPLRATVALVKGDFKDAAGIVVAPWAGSKATRGRILRRAGGVVTGAVTGFFTGAGPVGAIVGGVTGGMMAKKGVKGIKGYGKIALVSAATGGAASAVVGAAAQTGFSTGLLSQATAQKAILASGKAGMWGTGIAAGAPIPVLSTVGKLGVKGLVGVASTVKGIVGMIAPKASPAEVATQEQVQQAQQAAYGESYMDLLRQTSGVNPDTSGMYSQSRVNGQTWGGGEGQYMPVPTGDSFPGQNEATQVEYEPEIGIAKRELFPGLDKNILLIIGGVGLLAMIAYKKQ